MLINIWRQEMKTWWKKIYNGRWKKKHFTLFLSQAISDYNELNITMSPGYWTSWLNSYRIWSTLLWKIFLYLLTQPQYEGHCKSPFPSKCRASSFTSPLTRRTAARDQYFKKEYTLLYTVCQQDETYKQPPQPASDAVSK